MSIPRDAPDKTVNRTGTRSSWFIMVAVALPACQPASGAPADRSARPVPQIDVCFTPEQDCIDVIVDRVETARESVLVQAYMLTSAPVAKALLDAHKQGVKVRVILDQQNADVSGSQAGILAAAGIEVFLDAKHDKAHNKIIIIDESIILTGSLNFSHKGQAEDAENLLVITGAPSLARRFVANWHAHRLHSRLPAAEHKSVQTEVETVYVTPSGTKYHRQDCPHARKTGKPVTLEQARRAGKMPCSRCRPDETPPGR